MLCWGILLGALFFSLSACGKQKARIRLPHPPPAAPSVPAAEAEKSAAAPIPGTAQAAIDEPQAIIEETPGSRAERIDEAKGISLGPIIRIGLMTDAAEIRISSAGDYYLQEKMPEASRKMVRGNFQVRLEKEGSESRTFYTIQVASLRNPESAGKLKKDLEKTFDTKVTVRENAETGSSQIRAGEFPTREKANAMWSTLKHSGYPDAFIVKETASDGAGKSTLALRGADDLFFLNRSGFLFSPSSDDSFLSLNGKSYRGLLDVRLNGNNRITVINQLRMEEYLPGVVPAEINPSSYPEFAALAAQSIAARTYALRHIGQYGSQGFDLTDDDRTQVYGGVSIEKEATSEAVRRTAGLAIYYGDEVIEAMFMSTCGGRTEDSSNVYDTQPVPYLQSVICTIEEALDGNAAGIAANHRLQEPILAADGNVANRNLELARILDLIDGDSEFSPEFLSGSATKDEAIRWIKKAQKIARSNPAKPDEASIGTRIGFLKSAAEALFGPDEILRKISARDAAYYVENLSDGAAIPEDSKPALAYLMQNTLWHPFPDNTIRPDAPVNRSEALYLLLCWVEAVKPDILRNGVIAGPDRGRAAGNSSSGLQIKWGNSVREFQLSENIPIFRMEAGRRIPVNRARIIGNEKINFHFGPHETIDFLEVELNPTGAASDRYSSVATWDVSFTRSELGKKLSQLAGNIGEFRDLKPARIGNSGRAVQIDVIGSRSSVVLNGYKVRGALGLRDTLFTLTRKFNSDGSVAGITFHGRGYGHGIGLCQTGAYGMAKAGKSYEEILRTYYRGVEIRKAY